MQEHIQVALKFSCINASHLDILLTRTPRVFSGGIAATEVDAGFSISLQTITGQCS